MCFVRMSMCVLFGFIEAHVQKGTYILSLWQSPNPHCCGLHYSQHTFTENLTNPTIILRKLMLLKYLQVFMQLFTHNLFRNICSFGVNSQIILSKLPDFFLQWPCFPASFQLNIFVLIK